MGGPLPSNETMVTDISSHCLIALSRVRWDNLSLYTYVCLSLCFLLYFLDSREKSPIHMSVCLKHGQTKHTFALFFGVIVWVIILGEGHTNFFLLMCRVIDYFVETWGRVTILIEISSENSPAHPPRL